MKHGYGMRTLSCCLALVLLCTCLPVAAAAESTAYTGTVLMALNTDRRNLFANFETDRARAEDTVEAAAEPAEEAILPDAPLDDPEPLSGPQALLRQAQLGDVAPQAAAEYRVGDTKRIYSHYAVSEGKEYRRVDMVCTSVSDTVTVWREAGTENDHVEDDEKLALEMDERLPDELAFFGDKRIDTDGDGKMAVFLYEIDGENIGGYFSAVDLMDAIGRIGPVWHPSFSTSNHMDCIHVQGASRYAFIVETCLHEYQHYIQASYRYVGKNNFTALDAAETFINEGFSTAAEYLLFGVDRYSSSFAYASRPSNGLSFLNWKHDNGNYSMAFVFSQYVRTRYAALTNDLDSKIPGGTVYKTILEARTPKNDHDTMSIVADLLYPADAYPALRDAEARCRQLLADFWTAVFCQEPEGVHGFNGESWAKNIKASELVEQMPAGRTDYPIRSGMAAFYQIPTNDTDTVCITGSDDVLTFAVPQTQGFTLRFDANGGAGAPAAQIMRERCTIPYGPECSGRTFLGWALTPDAVSPQYASGNTIRLTADTTLYAVWQESPAVVTDTSYPMRRQGRELRNNYVFVPETDGAYKLTYTAAYGAWMQMYTTDGYRVDPSYQTGTTVYYTLTGGTRYDLSLEWSRTPPTSGYGTFILTMQDTYYTLTYRFDHPLVAREWSYSGATEYVADSLNEEIMPRFLGWAFTADAAEPDLGEGDSLTLTQDTTLYAVCAPDVPLPTDGSEARAAMINGAFLYVLRPEGDGMYALQWQPDGETTGETRENYVSLYDGEGRFLLNVEPETALTCALRGGETYYLYGQAETPCAVATCKKTSDRITTTLTFSVGKNALANLTLHGKTVCTIPDYTPAALDGRQFLGWRDEDAWRSYDPGDTITVTGDTVLEAQWSAAPKGNSEILNAVKVWVPNVIRALRQWITLRIADATAR